MNSDEGDKDRSAARRQRTRTATSAESLFSHCNGSRNPALAFNRAWSKIGYLACDGERSYFFYLTSALNEQALMLKMQRIGKAQEATRHGVDRDRDLRAFENAVARHFSDRNRILSTLHLFERIQRNHAAAARRPLMAKGRELTTQGGRQQLSTFAGDREELEQFKRHVNLLEFAASKGYRLDKRESSAGSKVLRHAATDDKIIVGRARDGHWQYFSVRDREDNGTIIDFLQRRERRNLGEIRRELREWTHTSRETDIPAAHRQVAITCKDRAKVALQVAQAKVVRAHPYLLAERALDIQTLNDRRFRGTWKQAAGVHANVLFPHVDEQGLCGFELKNHQFTGFAKGGEKGLWVSNTLTSDARLVITESAIDALSYHELHRDRRARYVSVAGELNPKQPALLDRAIASMPAGSVVVAATDNDKSGHAFAERIQQLSAVHPHVTFERHVPVLGKDWNDQLRALRLRSRELDPAPSLDRGR